MIRITVKKEADLVPNDSDEVNYEKHQGVQQISYLKIGDKTPNETLGGKDTHTRPGLTIKELKEKVKPHVASKEDKEIMSNLIEQMNNCMSVDEKESIAMEQDALTLRGIYKDLYENLNKSNKLQAEEGLDVLTGDKTLP